jgi:uncharacterized membrane protein
MPFCSHCGRQVGGADQFCNSCGARQPVNAPVPPLPPLRVADPLSGISPRTASIFCYVPGIGWIAAIIWLAAEKFRHDRAVRFHAFQGLYLFVAWLMNDWVLHPLSHFASHLPIFQVVQLALLGMSIFMMIKASQDQLFALPLFGELAQRSMTEDT